MTNREENADARRVEYITCPKCGEVAVLERDSANMSIVPSACPCGHQLGLGALLDQMGAASRAAAAGVKQ